MTLDTNGWWYIVIKCYWDEINLYPNYTLIRQMIWSRFQLANYIIYRGRTLFSFFLVAIFFKVKSGVSGVWTPAPTYNNACLYQLSYVYGDWKNTLCFNFLGLNMFLILINISVFCFNQSKNFFPFLVPIKFSITTFDFYF